MKKIAICLIVYIFLLAPCVKAEEVISLTIDDAIAFALRENHDILIKAEDIKKASAKLNEANASLMPTLTFTGSVTKTNGYYSKDITQNSTQTTAKQYLYKGGKIINTIKYNKYGVDIAQTILDKTKLEMILSVKKAFYTLLLAEEFAGVNKEIVQNIEEHLSALSERYKTGQASESDVLDIQAELKNAQEAYEASQGQVESAQILLNNLLYLAKDTKIKPNSQLTYEPIEVAYDEAFLKAMKYRPEIKQYELQEKAADRAVEIAKADGRPAIYAAWDYYSRSHTTTLTGVTKNWNDYNIIGLTFSWPIFDGWLTKSKVEQAIVDLKEAQLLKEKTSRDIALELKNAYVSLKNAIVSLKSSEADIKLYNSNLITTNEKYAQGLVSVLDKSDANLKYNVSLFNQKQTMYDYVVAKSSFEKATGGI